MFRLNALKTEKNPNGGFSVTISSAGEKTCTVRFPTDEEWCERVRKVRVYRTPVGRDKFKSDAPGQLEVDLDLFQRIRLDKGDGAVEFDAAEASKVITRLDSCRITNTEREGKGFRIWMEVPSSDDEVSILLRDPTQQQTKTYEDSSMSLLSGRRSQEWRSFLEPAGELFDSLVVSQQGYAAAVPITHKYAALRELLDQCEELVSAGGISIPEE
jgi:hypothetical protein